MPKRIKDRKMTALRHERVANVTKRNRTDEHDIEAGGNSGVAHAGQKRRPDGERETQGTGVKVVRTTR
jgi:hypothetical protein